MNPNRAYSLSCLEKLSETLFLPYPTTLNRSLRATGRVRLGTAHTR
jgi:hypothetical protein